MGIGVAHDAGYSAKEGLENQIILIPSGSQLARVVTAGGSTSPQYPHDGNEERLNDLAKTVPAAHNAKPEQFIEIRFLSNLEKSDLLRDLYR